MLLRTILLSLPAAMPDHTPPGSSTASTTSNHPCCGSPRQRGWLLFWAHVLLDLLAACRRCFGRGHVVASLERQLSHSRVKQQQLLLKLRRACSAIATAKQQVQVLQQQLDDKQNQLDVKQEQVLALQQENAELLSNSERLSSWLDDVEMKKLKVDDALS